MRKSRLTTFKKPISELRSFWKSKPIFASSRPRPNILIHTVRNSKLRSSRWTNGTIRFHPLCFDLLLQTYSVCTTAALNSHVPIEQVEEDYGIDGKVVHGKLPMPPPPLPPTNHKASASHIPLNPLTPRSDQRVTSPYNIHTLSSKQVMRLLKLIRYKILSWLNIKSS